MHRTRFLHYQFHQRSIIIILIFFSLRSNADGNLLEPDLVSPPLKRPTAVAPAEGDFVCATQPLESFGDRRTSAKKKDFLRPTVNSPKKKPNAGGKEEAAAGGGSGGAGGDGGGGGGDSSSTASQDRLDRQRILEYGAFSQPAKVIMMFSRN